MLMVGPHSSALVRANATWQQHQSVNQSVNMHARGFNSDRDGRCYAVRLEISSWNVCMDPG